MTAWDVLDKFISNFPPIAATILLLAAVVIFIVGFSKRGLNFIKYGFGKVGLDETLENRFDRLEKRLDEFNVELVTIKENHFGHLKNFLTELTSILVDKNVLNNTDKARLDNQLRGM